MDLKVFTSFSGYDSQCMALDRLEIGYDLVGWSEIDKYAIAAHNAVYPQYAERNYGNICNIKWSEVPSFNLFTYSSPCQDFSNAGLQRGGQEGSGTRSSLLWECRRAIECKRPDYLLMENVAALVSDKFIKLFNKWQITLEGYGYINYAKVLNAKDYGVPQNRERIFMVSVRKGLCHKFYFPKPFKLERRLKDVLEYNVDEKYYLSGERLNGLVSSTQKEEERGNGFKFDPKTEEDIATTVQTSGGSRKTDNFVIVPKIGAIRTRCKGNWVKGEKHQMRLEIGDDISNSLISVEKDNVLIEPAVLRKKRTEEQKKKRREMHDKGMGYGEGCYLEASDDGVSNTLASVQKDNIIVEPYNECEHGVARTIKAQYCKNGFANFIRSDGFGATGVVQIANISDRKGFDNPQDGRVYSEEGLSPTLQTSHGGGFEPKILSYSRDNKGKNRYEGGFRIRKLTPTECFRLMDVDDTYIKRLLESGISNSQLYKLAGNSIVVSCMYHIFRKLFVDTESEDGQLTIF